MLDLDPSLSRQVDAAFTRASAWLREHCPGLIVHTLDMVHTGSPWGLVWDGSDVLIVCHNDRLDEGIEWGDCRPTVRLATLGQLFHLLDRGASARALMARMASPDWVAYRVAEVERVLDRLREGGT